MEASLRYNRKNTTEDRLIAKIDAQRKMKIKPITATIEEIVTVKKERKAKRIPIVPLSKRLTVGQRMAYLEQQEQIRKDMRWKSLMSSVLSTQSLDTSYYNTPVDI